MQNSKKINNRISGVKHWWHQKVTAILLMPLTMWFLFSLPDFMTLSYEEKLIWINYDYNLILISLFFIISSYHMKIGLIVVIEDYIHNQNLKKIFSILVTVLILLIILLTLIINTYKFLGI